MALLRVDAEHLIAAALEFVGYGLDGDLAGTAEVANEAGNVHRRVAVEGKQRAAISNYLWALFFPQSANGIEARGAKCGKESGDDADSNEKQ